MDAFPHLVANNIDAQIRAVYYLSYSPIFSQSSTFFLLTPDIPNILFMYWCTDRIAAFFTCFLMAFITVLPQ